MAIKVYNTMTRKKEEFVPMNPGKASIYVCGVTPYNHPHIGNARPFVTWDVIHRFLEHEGYDVLHVQNFTDVDDKIINTANAEGVQWSDICGRYIESYFEVMDKLNVRRVQIYPRVSRHIPAAKPGEPAWDSPWGKGRPGWHIECSTMSMKYLGSSFDFHGGGSDLIFPHHENEIAQSEGATGVHPFVRYWLHNGFITVNEEKMSKSLGNFFTVKDILEHFAPETLRFFIVSTHYRSPLDFSDARLKEADASLQRLRTAKENLAALRKVISGGPTEESMALRGKVEQLRNDFMEAMRDDFNTALAISHMFALAKEINVYKAQADSGNVATDGKLVDMMSKVFAEFCSIIGVLEGEAEAAGNDGDGGLTEQLMQLLLELRQDARKAKNYAQADAIRNKLGELGIVIEDTPQGARWKKQ